MHSTAFAESVVKEAALAWLEGLGWTVKHGAEVAAGEAAAERDDYGQVVLAQWLRDALARLNPAPPAEALEDAFRKAARRDIQEANASPHPSNRPAARCASTRPQMARFVWMCGSIAGRCG